MAILNSGAQSANGATAPVMDVNEVHNSRPRGRNRFPMNYLNFFTARFGELTPFFCFQTTEQDTISLAVRHETRSHTLSAPLMSGVKFVKDTFAVPYQAILPRNWDLIYKNPKFGDDVPFDSNSLYPVSKSGSSVSDSLSTRLGLWWSGFLRLIFYYKTNVPTTAVTASLLKLAFALEWFASSGSLLNILGYHSHAAFVVKDSATSDTNLPHTFDDVLESILAELRKKSFTVTCDAGSVTYNPYSPTVGYDANSSFHAALTLMRDNLDFSFGASDNLGNIFANVGSLDYSASFTLAHAPFNYAPLLAYQSVVAQLYTNDNIDDIYSWDLYLSAAETLVSGVSASSMLPFFLYNGNRRLYDVFSGNVVKTQFSSAFTLNISAATPTISVNTNALLYLSMIFSLRHSLRLGDYFAGSRPNPLAIGDVTAPVVNSGVSAIDTTRSILMQRFLNAVNKSSGQIQGYEQEMLGGNLPPDIKLPKYISHEVDGVSGDEIDNTADNQGAIVQNIRSYGGKYLFETSFSCPAIVLGICYFDASRVYSKTIDRLFLQEDRFDMFNPYLQTIGDQPIYQCELDASKPYDSNFGYQTRNADMKQRYSIASGGFVRALPAWAFVTDNLSAGDSGGDVISSRFVRNYPYVFDRFYSHLTGSSLSYYFHFIVKMDINLDTRRSMLKSPSIL